MWFKRDPGPCPVDDSAHTTCTSEDYDPATILAGPIVPATTALASAPTPIADAEPAPTVATDRLGRTRLATGTFTSGNYGARKRAARRQPTEGS